MEARSREGAVSQLVAGEGSLGPFLAKPGTLFTRTRLKRFLALVGLSMALVLLFVPTPDGLAPEGQRAVVAFVAAVTLWVTNLMPPPVTGLLGMALVPLHLDVLAAGGDSVSGHQSLVRMTTPRTQVAAPTKRRNSGKGSLRTIMAERGVERSAPVKKYGARVKSVQEPLRAYPTTPTR